MDEIRDKYYDLVEFILELEQLTRAYKDKVDINYLEQIDAIWSEAIDEKNDLQEQVEAIEEAENKCLEYEYERMRA